MNAEFLALAIIILLFSVILHEVMHGYVALRFGDRTALNAGRLTLNPLPHIDLVGTILLPAVLLILPVLTGVNPGFFLAWAKPVPINPLNFSDIKKGELYVSLAGVLANFGLAVVGAVLYHLSNSIIQSAFLAQVAQFTVGINLMLGIFNLFPIPPLDGSKVLMSQLPLHLAREYERFSGMYGMFLLIFLIYFNIIGAILGFLLPPFYSLLGVPRL